MSFPTERPETNEWYTPPDLFEAMRLKFDVDPCSPIEGPLPWIPAARFIDQREDGLKADWGNGRVWLNPPYGDWGPHFLKKLVRHCTLGGSGIALMYSRTETDWFHDFVRTADCVLFLKRRVRFVKRDGVKAGPGKVGSLLAAWGGTYGEDSDVCSTLARMADTDPVYNGGIWWPKANRP